MSPTAPLVRAVVVNYEGGDLTLACLRSLHATDWPPGCLEIVLVDNASHDGVADTVARDLRDVRVVRSTTNRGFAGGCNLGMTDLAETGYVALVNNDATVEPGWLTPLVAALQDDPALGAACPKILLAGQFRDLSIHTPTVRRGGRDLGVWVSGARIDGVNVWSRVQLVRGFWGLEPPWRVSQPPGQWTGPDALLRIPVDGEVPVSAELQLSADQPVTATISSTTYVADIEVTTEPAWFPAKLAPPSIPIVNNAGSVRTADGHGADRGYLEPDDGRFDAPEDVFAWCGAGVVLRREYLDDVGLLDERLFVYYEDLELSWRGHARGWRYRFVPGSVLHHVHAATTIDGSKLKLHHEERNRLLVLTRHAAPRDAWRAVVHHLLVTASYARRDIFGRVVRGRLPRGAVVGWRLRAFGAFVVRAPGMLRSRRQDRIWSLSHAERGEVTK